MESHTIPPIWMLHAYGTTFARWGLLSCDPVGASWLGTHTKKNNATRATITIATNTQNPHDTRVAGGGPGPAPLRAMRLVN
jgi:hypothetical protein